MSERSERDGKGWMAVDFCKEMRLIRYCDELATYVDQFGMAHTARVFDREMIVEVTAYEEDRQQNYPGYDCPEVYQRGVARDLWGDTYLLGPVGPACDPAMAPWVHVKTGDRYYIKRDRSGRHPVIPIEYVDVVPRILLQK